ncbi:hypothetical protein [Aquisalimonas asiatica]|uniref:Uncharacterized protein n=1 Tax=Aquisalimonas asiatica TaxID=406100 RepID=A0A1H8V384_9GAMM|nr:hypothetical protein [Aquisalimonas asiatica]SEP09693.1 hypothetical protein SAMN04488052_10992 [Aquisalimonas asiatica]
MAYVQAFGTVIGGYFRQLGVLRAALIVGSVIVMVMAPAGDAQTVYEGMGFVETVVMPTLAPLFLVGLLLDALMSRVWMSDNTPDEVARLRLIIRSELLVSLVLVIAYAPFFMSLAA